MRRLTQYFQYLAVHMYLISQSSYNGFFRSDVFFIMILLVGVFSCSTDEVICASNI